MLDVGDLYGARVDTPTRQHLFDNIDSDVNLAARDLGVPVPGTAAISQTLRAAVNAGLGESNFSALHKYLFQISS